MIDAHPACESCGREITRGEAMLAIGGAPAVCRASECQGLLGQRLTMSPEAYRVHFQRQSSMIRLRHTREAQRQAHISVVDTAEAEENQRITDQVRGTRDDGERLVSLALPRGVEDPAAATPERRKRFQAHLEAVIAEAESLPENGGIEAIPEERYKGAMERNHRVTELLEQQPALQERYDQLCGVCRGGCCAAGEEHAYLTAHTIRRLLDADAALTGADLLATYLEHAPHESMERACFLQTPTGCAMPRELRSDVCNGYFCPQLVSLQVDWSEEDPRPALAIQRAHHVWNRYVTTTTNPVTTVVVVDQDGVQTINLTTPRPT